MKREPQPTDVRRIVLDMFRQLGESPQGLSDLQEEIVITNEGQNARKYQAGKLLALWTVETDVLQCRAAQGEVLATLHLRQEAA
jgi:hypothetical protein